METGLEAYFNDRLDEAIRAFKAVLALDPSNELARKNLENAEHQQKIRLKALKTRERLNMNAAERAFDEGQWVEAQELLMDILSRVPDHPEALHLKNILRVKVEREIESTRSVSERWIELQGDLAYLNGDWKKAVLSWERVLELHPKRKDLLGRLEKARVHEKSQERLERLEGLAGEARGAQREGRFQKAQDLWLELLALDPENPLGKEGLSRARSAYQEISSAQRQKTIQTLQVRAIDAGAEGKRAEALELWREIVAMDPENVLARDHLPRLEGQVAVSNSSGGGDVLSRARAHIQEHRYVEAIEALERQLARSPGDGRTEDLLKEARERQKASVEVLYREGLGLYAKNLKNQAILKWQEVLRMDPEFVRAKQALVKTMQEVGER